MTFVLRGEARLPSLWKIPGYGEGGGGARRLDDRVARLELAFLLGILCFLLLALLCSQQLLRMCMRCFGTMSQASRRDLHGDGVIHDVLIRLIYGSYEGI